MVNYQGFEFEPRKIAVATTTYFPKYYHGELNWNDNPVHKIRGNQVVQLATISLERGYRVAVVDGGSSKEFRDTLTDLGVSIEAEREKGMSPSRRQVLRLASGMEHVEAICWMEEKPSMVQDGLPKTAIPVLAGKADIAIPKRDAAGYATYPPYQAEMEQKANPHWNLLLIEHGILKPDDEELDVWFGPRVFKNSPEVMGLVMQRYQFKKDPENPDHKHVDPEKYSNTTFIPVAAALVRGLAVVSVPIDYRHPKEQTQIETGDKDFDTKRDHQFIDIVTNLEHWLWLIEGNPQSRLSLAST